MQHSSLRSGSQGRALGRATRRQNGASGKTGSLASQKGIQAMKTQPSTRRTRPPGPSGIWKLRLYVAGQTPNCARAFANLRKICEEHLAGKYRIDVIDLLESPQLSRGDQILAIPTLVRRLPPPVRKIIGDLSNTERVLIGLDIRQGKAA